MSEQPIRVCLKVGNVEQHLPDCGHMFEHVHHYIPMRAGKNIYGEDRYALKCECGKPLAGKG